MQQQQADVLRTRQRILVLGPCGSGKSTLARKLADVLPLPLFHLDAEYWQPDWVEPDPDVWLQRVEQLIAGDRWIIDGGYGSSLERRLQRADAAIVLDYPRMVYMANVLERVQRYAGQVRPDLAEGCEEKLDFEFLHYVWNFARTRTPKVRRLVHGAPPEVQRVFLYEPAEAEDLLRCLNGNSTSH